MSETLKIVKMFKDVKTPVRANSTDVGYDVYAYSFNKYYQNHGTNFEREFEGDKLQETFVRDKSIDLAKNERILIGTGIKAAVSSDYEIQVRARSGLALKQGLTVCQGIGTIDPLYRDEISVIITNTSSKTQTVKLGERIAQFVPKKIYHLEIEEVTELDTNDRGGGFGHTGKE